MKCIVCRSRPCDGTGMCDVCWDSFHKLPRTEGTPPSDVRWSPTLVAWVAERVRRYMQKKKRRK